MVSVIEKTVGPRVLTLEELFSDPLPVSQLMATRHDVEFRMNTKDFEVLLVEGRIESVTINRIASETAGWEIIVQGGDVAPDVKPAIELNGSGSRRSWADLEATYLFIRKSGYRGMVQISENPS